MTAFPWRPLAASCFLVIGAAACGDDTTTDSGTTGLSVTYADVQAVWDASCSGSSCHTDGGTAGGLALDEGSSYDNLVGTAALGAALDLISAGSIEDSYLWHKLGGTQADVGGAGSDMPLGDILAAAQLSDIESWIQDGALAD